MIIEIDGITIQVTKKAIKSMNLRIYPPDGLVKVSAPLKFSERVIRQHLQTKMDWIVTQRNKIQNKPQPAAELYKTGSSLMFMGKQYLLLIEEHNGPQHIKLNDQLIHCYTHPQTTQAHVKILFEQWYKQRMSSLLPERITYWEKVIGVQVKQWGIKKMKTRWGSCNTAAARIWLNLNLIKKPIDCLEYVLVHELIHLLEPSHNHRFYALMDQFMPQWREHQITLEGKRRLGKIADPD